MLSVIFSLIEFAYAIVLIAVIINLYSKYQSDFKRKIFAVVVGIVVLYYFIFASIQLIKDEILTKILNNISLISLVIATSISLFYLSSFLSAKYYKYHKKLCYIMLFISIITSIILIIIPENPISIEYNGYYWIYIYKITETAYLLLFYFLSIFCIILVFFIILMINKSYKTIKFYFYYSFIFILPFVYFIKFKNPLFIVFIQNSIIMIWVLLNFTALKDFQKEIVNFFKFQVDFAEELDIFQFLLNRHFNITDTSKKTIKKLGYDEEEIIGRRIDYILLNFLNEKIKVEISSNDEVYGIYKLRKKNNEEIIVDLYLTKIKNDYGEVKGYIVICSDIESRQKFEIQSQKHTLAKNKYNEIFENLKSLFDMIEDPVSLLDEKGRLITANKSFIDIYKKVKEEILILDDLLNSKEKNIEKIIKFSDGNKNYYYKYFLNSVSEKKDMPVGYICVLENFTDKINIQKNLEKIFENLKFIVLNFPFPLIIFDEEENLLLYSKKLLSYIYKKEKIEKIDITKIKSDFTLNSLFDKLKDQDYSELNNYYLDLSKILNIKHSRKFHCNLFLFKLSNDFNIYGLILENIEKNLMYKKRMQKIKDSIDNDINEKTKFLYSLSFEFRKNIVDLIEKINVLILYETESLREFLLKIRENSITLLSQIDSIILYEILQKDTYEYNYQNIEIFSFLNSLINKYKKEIQRKNLNFNSYLNFGTNDSGTNLVKKLVKKDSQLYLYFDPSLLKIVLDSIISNSIKFTEKGSIDFIANLRKLGEENYELNIKIKDTGIGIEKGKLGSIFDKYYQVDNVFIKRYSGLGLGLYNAKKICEYLGAELTIESNEDKGTLVSINIPLMKSELVVNKEIKMKDKIKNQNFKFIITFEDDNVLDSIKNICKKKESTFFILNDLKDLGKILARNIDFIVLINLDLIGDAELKTLEKIKYERLNENIRLVFVALYSYPYNDKKIKEISRVIDFVIIRPFEIEEFLSKLEEFYFTI